MPKAKPFPEPKSPGFVDTGLFGLEEFTMAKTRGAYPPEFRRQMVDLLHAGRTPEELAHELEPTAEFDQESGGAVGARRRLEDSGARPESIPNKSMVYAASDAGQNWSWCSTWVRLRWRATIARACLGILRLYCGR
jgi:hypothetical protein